MIIDKEKIDPFNEEDWNEKDIIFFKYGYKFDDNLKTIDISQNIRSNIIEIEYDNNNITNNYIEKYKFWNQINKNLNAIISDNRVSIRFYNHLIEDIKRSKIGIFYFTFVGLSYKKKYFINPLKEYCIIINKNNLTTSVYSKYKITKKNTFKFYNSNHEMGIKFGFLDTIKSLKKLNFEYSRYIKDKKNDLELSKYLCRSRKHYSLNIIS